MPDLPPHLTDYLRSSHVALALASPEHDNELLLVNDRFCALTGFVSDEVIGRNCRFLQRDADNAGARARIHRFLAEDRDPSVRTEIVNFRKDGTPFVNLLFMSKLNSRNGGSRLLFASQFDISRSRPEMLADYDAKLSETLKNMVPILSESGIVMEGSLMAIANSASTIAQAKLLLSTLDDTTPLA
ncbi:MAG: PAS domain-containing protein [Methylobacterium mesophilicum]|nr:PAS domain-containing protein [Methylobacterium mesophilicum]